MRIFIAAILPYEIKKYIGEYIVDIKDSVSGVKWEIPEKLHITLKFIGKVEKSYVDKIVMAIGNYQYGEKPIRMKISGIDGFPNFKNPRVLIVRFEQTDILNEIRDYVEDALSQVGIEKDSRNFVPHTTIGRVKRKFNVKRALPIIETREFKLVSLDVMNSVLSKAGSNYFTHYGFDFG